MKTSRLIQRATSLVVSLSMVSALMTPYAAFAVDADAGAGDDPVAFEVPVEDETSSTGTEDAIALAEDGQEAPEGAAEEIAAVEDVDAAAEGADVAALEDAAPVEEDAVASDATPEADVEAEESSEEDAQPDVAAQGDVVFDEKGTVTVNTALELALAFVTVPKGGTVILGDDIVMNHALAVTTQDFTLNLNNHKLTRALSEATRTGSVITILSEGHLSIRDGIRATGEISGGWTTSSGGAIDNRGSLDIVGTTICGNRCAYRGGAIRNAGTLSLSNCYILDNEAGTTGGGIYNEPEATANIVGGKINGNKLTITSAEESEVPIGQGGGICNAGQLVLRDCEVKGNSAVYGAGVSGAMWKTVTKNPGTVVSNCSVTENAAGSIGGGVYASGSHKDGDTVKPSVTIEDGTKLTDNKASSGAGLYVAEDGVALVKTATISNNTSSTNGGGIYAKGTLQMSDAPVVRDNATTRQHYLYPDMVVGNLGSSAKPIEIVGALTDGAYVSWRVSPYEGDATHAQITTGYATFNGTDDPAKYFVATGSNPSHPQGHTVFLRGGEAYVGANIPYVDESGKEQICYDYTDLGASAKLDGLTEGWYVVCSTQTHDVRAKVSSGHVRLILCDDAKITISQGINVVEGTTFTVYGQKGQTGELVATGTKNNAGIGSNEDAIPGDITINGGTITATGGRFAAGIGTGKCLNRSNLTKNSSFTLNRGTVSATGGEFAAGLGGGQRMCNLHTIINGGTLVAKGVNQGAGIGGGGNGGIHEPIEINGGEVTAIGAGGGAGIGSGFEHYPTVTAGIQEHMYFRGGHVVARTTAEGSGMGAAIGSGGYYSYGHRFDSYARDIYLSGSIIEAYGTKPSASVNRENIASAVGTGVCAKKDLMIVLNHSEIHGVESMDYMVKDSDGNRVLADERRDTCLYGGSIRLEPCDHLEYEMKKLDDGGETAICKYCGAQAAIFTATFEPGEGTGDAYTERVIEDRDLTLPPATTFESPDGVLKLTGWKAGDTTYEPGEKIRLTEDTTFVAQWTFSWAILQECINEAPDGTKIRIVLPEGVTATEDDTTLVIPKGKHIRLDVSDYSIDRNASAPCADGTAIIVRGTLELHGSGDATVTGGNTTGKGGGVYVDEGGSFWHASGRIAGNAAASGGGVYVAKGASVQVNGEIMQNRATSSNGAGVLVEGGDVTIKTGTICENTAARFGGGLMLSSGTLTLEKGYVSDNVAGSYGGGLYVSTGSVVEMSSYAYIRNNLATSKRTAGDVYLEKDAVLTVPDTTDVPYAIGVTTKVKPKADAPVVLTKGLKGHGEVSFFASDVASYVVGENEDGEAILGTSATVSFAAGEGSGTMASVKVAAMGVYTLPACDFEAPDGSAFTGWKASTGGVHKAGSTMTITGNVTLTAQWKKTFDVWVGSTQVTSENYTDVLGDGTVTFDPETNTLTLNNPTIKGMTGSAKIHASDLDLTVLGTGTISSEEMGIYVFNGSLSIGGDFTISGSPSCIFATQDVTILSGTMRINAHDTQSVFGIRSSWGTITVKGDVERLEAWGERAFSTRPVSIADELVIQTPEGGYAANRSIVDENGEIATHVVIVREEKPAFKTHSLVLEGRIGVNFYLDLSMLTEAERKESYLEFAVAGKDGTTTKVPFDADFTNPGGNGYYGFTAFVNAIQMADTITATLHYPHYGTKRTVEETYSVESYIKGFEAKRDSFDDKTIALVEALGDYGHYAQPYLSALHRWKMGTNHAVMETCFATNLDWDEAAAYVASRGVKRTGSDPDLARVSYALSLDTDTELFVHVKPSKDYDGPITATVDGEDAEVIDLGTGTMRVVASDIIAQELSDQHTFVITTESGSVTIKASALSYVKTCLDKKGDTDEVKDVKNAVTALYRYYRAAEAYVQD